MPPPPLLLEKGLEEKSNFRSVQIIRIVYFVLDKTLDYPVFSTPVAFKIKFVTKIKIENIILLKNVTR